MERNLERFDTTWFSAILEAEVVAIEWDDVSFLGFMSGVKKVRVTLKSREVRRFILKFLLTDSFTVSAEMIISMGCAREADFYNSIDALPRDKKCVLQRFLPKVYHAKSDWTTGEKEILMEDLSDSGIVSGLYFGAGSHSNQGKDLAKLTSRCPGVCPLRITRETFFCIAQLHATFWNTTEFSDIQWVRGGQWVHGGGREKWESSMSQSIIAFKEMEKGVQEDTMEVPEKLWLCMENFFRNLRWENFMKELKVRKFPWTFIHGDFHANNVMWMPDDDNCHVRLFDWEVVGIGSGPQELGRYVISHLDVTKYGPDVQQSLVKAYYEELLLANPSIRETMSFDACFENFVYGGLRDWVWMLPMIGKWRPDIAGEAIKKVELFRQMHSVRPGDVAYLE